MNKYIKPAVIVFLLISCLAVYMSLNQSNPVSSSNPLYERIKSKQQDYFIEPQNAYIDQVWKKTPGLNGRKVSIEKSYNKMKKDGKFNEDKLVFEQIPPEVSLEDLPVSPIYRGHPDKEMVALLINVSWGAEFIPDMVETLSKHRVKANFFIDGAFAAEHKDLVQMIEEEGHLIGSHGYGHKDFAKLSKSQAMANLDKANSIISSLIDSDIEWFAPPAGSFTMSAVEAAQELDMQTILWTVDSIDWKKPTKDVFLHRITSKLHNGATVLMHPTAVTASSLDELIPVIQKQYRIGTLAELMSEKRGG